MRPIIIRIPSELAKPFVDAYCDEYEISKENSPDYGFEVKWVGAVLQGEIQAVLGFVALPQGVYCHAYHFKNGNTGRRAFLALNEFTYKLKQPLWGYIDRRNEKMLNRMLKEGWEIALDHGKDTLIHWPCYN